MNSKKLLAYPLVEELEYRQNIDSDQLNKMFHSIEESVLRAIMRGSEAQDLLTRLNLATESSNTAMATKITNIAGMLDLSSTTMFATGYQSVTTYTGHSVNQDKVAGHITMPFVTGKNLSKIPRYDSDNDGISDTVSPSVKIRVDNDERAQDDPIYNMLNRRYDSFWVEQLSANTDHTIEIELPPSLSKKFNYIELLPLPVFGFDIVSIKYVDLRGNDQEIIRPSRMPKDGPCILHIAPKQFNNIIKIVVNSSTGVVGFTNIDIALVDYQNTSQTFYMPFTGIPVGDKDISVVLDFYVDAPSTNYGNFIRELKLVTDTSDSSILETLEAKTTPQDFSDSISLAGKDSLYLKVTMQEIDLTTPIIYGCTITY